MDHTIKNLWIPGLKKIHSGKVRESFRTRSSTSRYLLATDRVSAFDHKLQTPIPFKGSVLNMLSYFWFARTSHIVRNHFIRLIDPNIMEVKEVKAIPLEIIVRTYLTGSLWRSYQGGRRVYDGTTLPDNLKKNCLLPAPISPDRPMITFTTKGITDLEISRENIIKEGLLTAKQLEEIMIRSSRLFAYASELSKSKGIILVDTKYEFGVDDDGQLTLIDEIHTPDSSRFWDAEEYLKNPQEIESVASMDKEFLRQWLRENEQDIVNQPPSDSKDHASAHSTGKITLPEHIVNELSKRYLQLYSRITGDLSHPKILTDKMDPETRIYYNLLKAGVITPGLVSIIMGSKSDLDFAKKIKCVVEKYGISCEFRVISAHKNGEEIYPLSLEYNYAVGPLVVIAVAGKSNALGGALAMNLNAPVINCPYMSDKLDFILNINSSLLMPSKTPVATITDPESAALFALRCLQIPALKNVCHQEIFAIKQRLKQEDIEVREEV